MYKLVIKRILDFLIALMFMPLICIVTVLVGLAIKVDDGGKIFYTAKRRGRGGRIFLMYKYRSMIENAPDLRNEDNSAYSSKSDVRVTRTGRFIRKTSIDELPQLFNVLLGDMSLIGPRPNTPSKNYDSMSEQEKKRLSVKPGITGYSQANYRNSITQSEKLEKDLYYVDNLSLSLDIKILIHTVITVLLQKNINTNESR